MNAHEIWIWLVAGVIPYRIERRWLAQGIRTLEIRALFWSLAVRRQRQGRRDWKLSVPLIERLRDAVWAALMRLRDGQPPQA